MELREAIEKLTMWHQANPRTGPLGVVMNAVADGTLIPADAVRREALEELRIAKLNAFNDGRAAVLDLLFPNNCQERFDVCGIPNPFAKPVKSRAALNHKETE